MLALILPWLGNLLGGPFVQGALNAYKAKLTADNNADKIAADLAGRELAVQQREIEVDAQLRIAEIGKWYEPDHVIGYLVAFLLGKLIVWDICFGWGSTDLHAGLVTQTVNLVIISYFGKRGFENVARIIKRK